MEAIKTKALTTKYNIPWIENRADPYVYRHTNGLYYFTASIPEYDRIVLRVADSLGALTKVEEYVVWEKHETGIMSEHIWAPEIHYLDGKWYIYFAAGEKDDVWKIRPFVLMCEDENPMSDKWIEKGKMQSADNDDFSFEGFSLDATVFEANNKRYFVWAEKVGVGKQISNLYIAEMETPTKLKTIQVLLSTPDYHWERIEFWVNEGPAVIKKNGKIFLTFSASSTGASYCMGMLVADEGADLLDPSSWAKSKDPVLKTDRIKGIYGPGHNSFTTSLSGKDIMIYHARQYAEIDGNPLYDPNRHAMMLEVKWNKAGEPVFEFMSMIDFNKFR